MSENKKNFNDTTPTNSLTDLSVATSTLSLKSFNFDGLQIEVTCTPKVDPAKIENIFEEEEASETDCEETLDDTATEITNDCDNASTVNLDDIETKSTTDHNTEAYEEEFDGAAGLWAQNFQLPCFSTVQVERFETQSAAPIMEHHALPVGNRTGAVPKGLMERFLNPVNTLVNAGVLGTIGNGINEEEVDPADLAELHASYDYVQNSGEFRCDLCLQDIQPGDGLVLKDCIHQYCKDCLTRYIERSAGSEISCPYRDEAGQGCIGVLMDSELRSLVPLPTYINILRKSLAEAEAANPNAYHCKTPNCHGWVDIDGEIESFECEVCKQINCCMCKSIHQGISCQDYRNMVHEQRQGGYAGRNRDGYMII